MIIYIQAIFRSTLEAQEFYSISNKLFKSLYRFRPAIGMKDPALLFEESVTKGAEIELDHQIPNCGMLAIYSSCTSLGSTWK
jgi:hypothetical protein